MTILFSPSPVEVFLIPLQSKQIFHKVSARRRCSARYLCRVRNGRHVLHELLLIPSYEGKPWVVPGGNFYRRLHAPIVWNAHLVVVHAGRLRGMAVTGREGSSQWWGYHIHPTPNRCSSGGSNLDPYGRSRSCSVGLAHRVKLTNWGIQGVKSSSTGFARWSRRSLPSILLSTRATASAAEALRHFSRPGSPIRGFRSVTDGNQNVFASTSSFQLKNGSLQPWPFNASSSTRNLKTSKKNK